MPPTASHPTRRRNGRDLSTYIVTRGNNEEQLFWIEDGELMFTVSLGDAAKGFPDETLDAALEGSVQFTDSLIRSAGGPDHVAADQLGAAADASVRTMQLLLRHNALLEHLSIDRRKVVSGAVGQMMALLVEQAHRREVAPRELELRAQAAVDALTILVEGNSRQMQTVVEALKPVTEEDAEAIDEVGAAARGRLRLQALYGKLINDSYTVADLRNEWGLSRQRLKQLRDEDRLFAVKVPHHKGFLYPEWQFEPGTSAARPIMPLLIAAARDAGMDAITFHQVMVGADAGGDAAPVDLLDRGADDIVLGIIAANDV